jgi:hypothetical protein
MHLPVLIKTPYKHSYFEIIHHFIAYKHKCQNKYIYIYIYIYQDARGKTLIRNNTKGYATTKRGARFHPTVGSVPVDLPLDTPEMRPRCCETAS